jgi:hypothetical protein
MRSTCRLLAALCCLVLASAGIANAAPLTDVVFGNLGESGTNALSTTNTDITSTYRLAVPFTTGSGTLVPLKLQSITLGLFYDNTLTADFGMSIYSDNAGVPSTTPFATAPAQSISTASLYTYNFGNVALAEGATYWIVPGVDLSWYTPLASPTPQAFNGSGYSWPGTGLASSNGGTSWNTNDLVVVNGRYAFSVQAVPEPSTYALAALGLGVAGFVRARRRKSAV